MSLSLKRSRSTERYSQTLRPSVFAIKTDGKERPAPWLARAIKWIVAMRPEQTRRALWLSKPVDWFKKIYSAIRRMTPKQLSRTMWLTKLFYRMDKIFPSRKNTTFGSIRDAMDNSHFRHLSKPEESPKMCKQ
jgi:hypothetical protein